jgi:hypothetical protein
MMFLIVILFYTQKIFVNLSKKHCVLMSINSNTLYNTIYNYTSGYDERYPRYEKTMSLKNNIYKLHIKKHILDILENKDININDKIEVLHKYNFLHDTNSVKTINLKAGGLMEDFEYDF